jgi:FtsH-binding integral membrane protein
MSHQPFPGEQPAEEVHSLSGETSQNTAPTTGEPKTCKQKVMQNVRWVTALTGLGLVVAAIFSFLSSVLSFSISGIILCIYLCPIGFIISITELEKFFYARVIQQFPILRTHVGRGFAYIFIAGDIAPPIHL